MSKPHWTASRPALKQALLLGTRRQSIEIPEPFDQRPTSEQPDKRLLGVIAGLAWRQRFERPSAPTTLLHSTTTITSEQLVTQSCRVLLRRLFGQKRTSFPAISAQRVLCDLRVRNTCLHPFDYHHLIELMKSDPELLDDFARRWLDSRNTESALENEGLVISEDSWHDFPPAIRVAYMQRLHQSDGPAARALCECVLSSEAAATRAKLLSSFELSIDTDDVAFLEAHSTDKSKVVRGVVTDLLSLIPGTQAHGVRIDSAVDRLKLTSKGVLKRRQVIEADAPANLNDAARHAWICATFDHIHPARLADSLQMDVKSFSEQLNDEALAGQCCIAFAANNESELLHNMAQRLGKALLESLALSQSRQLKQLDELQLSQLLDEAISAHGYSDWTSLVNYIVVICEDLSFSVSDESSNAIVAAPGLRKYINKINEDSSEDDVVFLESLVAVLKHDALSTMSVQLEGLAPAVSLRAGELIELIAAIRQSNPSHKRPSN